MAQTIDDDLIVNGTITASGLATVADLQLSGIDSIWTDVRSYATFEALVADIGSVRQNILVAEDCAFADDLQIPAEYTLVFVNGAKFTVASTKTVTFLGRDIHAGDWQIFDGEGAFTFAAGTKLRSTWFADLETASTHIDTACTLIIAAPETITGTVSFVAGVHLEFEAANLLTIDTGATLEGVESVSAGQFQCFAGDGTVEFASGMYLRSSWFPHLRTVAGWLGSTKALVIIDKSETIDVSTSLNANTSIMVIPGNVLTVPGGNSLTIPGQILAFSLFTAGAGTITLSGTSYIGSNFVQVGGAADDVNSGAVAISPGRIEVGPSTTFAAGYDPNVALLAAQQAQFDATQALADAADSQNTADGKITSFFTNVEPVGVATGDLWFDTGTNNTVYVWNGAAWVSARDSGIAAAVSAASTAQSTADGKIETFFSDSTNAPVSPSEGDIWYQTDTGIMKIYYSGSWDRPNYGVQTYLQASQPTGASAGDLWIDSDNDNRLYYYNGSAWVETRDGGIQTAIDDAANALALAASAQPTYMQNTEPGSPADGDLWYNTSSQRLNIYDDTAGYWRDLQTGYKVTHAATYPGSPSNNDLFVDTDTWEIFRYDSGAAAWLGFGTSSTTIVDGGLIFTGSLIARDGANNQLAGITGNASSNVNTDVRFWAGTSYANRANAPFKVTQAGSVTAADGAFRGLGIYGNSAGGICLTIGAPLTTLTNSSPGFSDLGTADGEIHIYRWAAPTLFATTTAYSRGSLIYETAGAPGNTYIWECTVGGTSGGTPTWSTNRTLTSRTSAISGGTSWIFVGTYATLYTTPQWIELCTIGRKASGSDFVGIDYDARLSPSTDMGGRFQGIQYGMFCRADGVAGIGVQGFCSGTLGVGVRASSNYLDLECDNAAITSEGGLAILCEGASASALTRGELVCWSSGLITKASTSTKPAIGVVYKDVANSLQDVIVVVSGLAYVLPLSSLTPTSGNCIIPSTTAGRANESAGVSTSGIGYWAHNGTGSGSITLAVLR